VCDKSDTVTNLPVLSLHISLYPFIRLIGKGGARGDVTVKALRYKPAGRGFDSRWCH
jgi:hypothetical protein